MKLNLLRRIKPYPLTAPGEKIPARAEGQATVQNWLPVRDISGGLLTRSDGHMVAVIRVKPAPFTLLSQAEKTRRIAALHEAIQALPGAVQICALPRPIDLDSYIADLEARQVEVEGSQKAVLRGYVHYVRSLAVNAEATERRFYVLVNGEGKNRGGREELLQRVQELVAALARAELQAHLCNDREVLDLMFCFFHPAQVAFERPAYPTVAPVYMTAKEVMEYGVD
ncbi:MAG: hypothetical protein ACYC2T_15855 [Bacillota bacterium]